MPIGDTVIMVNIKQGKKEKPVCKERTGLIKKDDPDCRKVVLDAILVCMVKKSNHLAKNLLMRYLIVQWMGEDDRPAGNNY